MGLAWAAFAFAQVTVHPAPVLRHSRSELTGQQGNPERGYCSVEDTSNVRPRIREYTRAADEPANLTEARF